MCSPLCVCVCVCVCVIQWLLLWAERERRGSGDTVPAAVGIEGENRQW